MYALVHTSHFDRRVVNSSGWSGLPELPPGWSWAALGSIAEVKLGKMLSPKAYEQGLVQLPYLRNENVRWGTINVDDVKTMGFKEAELERYSLEAGDLMVCEGGEAGRCAVYKGHSQRLMYQNSSFRQVKRGSEWPEERSCIAVGQAHRVPVLKPRLWGGPTGCKLQCTASCRW